MKFQHCLCAFCSSMQEVFRLLIVAFQNSIEALPVLSYFMAVLVLFSATGIYMETWPQKG